MTEPTDGPTAPTLVRAVESARGIPTAHELRVFVRLAENLHFGQTAAELKLAQSSLSEAIRRLEAKVAAVLFERTSRRVSLTDQGAQLIPVARRILDGLDEVHSAVARPPRVASRITVGIEGQGFAELNRPLIAGFHADRPDTPVHLVEATGVARAFLEAGIDVGLMRSPLPDDRLTVHELATEPRGMLVPLTHWAVGIDGLSIDDFLDERFVAIGPRGSAARAYWSAQERHGSARPRFGGKAVTMIEAVHAVAHLGLVTTGCASLVRTLPFSGIAHVDVEGLSPAKLTVVTRADEQRPEVLAFVDFARRVVAERAPQLVGAEG